MTLIMTLILNKAILDLFAAWATLFYKHILLIIINYFFVAPAKQSDT